MAENVVPDWVDSHCHWDFPVFDVEREAHWQQLQQLGCRGLVIPGTEAQRWLALIELCQHQPWFYALGIHPWFLKPDNQAALDLLESLCQQHSPVSIGEIGLDYSLEPDTYDSQQAVFEAQLDIAQQHNLPVIIHAHKAYDQVSATIRRKQFNGGGIVHAFGGSAQQAHKLLDMGLKLGIGGAISHTRASRLRTVIAALPADGWVLETDAPDMKPAFWAGKTNSPAALPMIAQLVSALRQQRLESTFEQHMNTLRSLFPRLADLPKG